jgi:DNA invertase Pin-like site-specific DNA recombinase
MQLDVATPLWDHAAMTEEEVVTRLKQAAEAKRTTEQAATKDFEAAVVDALRGGMKPAAVAKATDYSYETIRRIARKYDLAPLREPTVTSRKKAQPGGDSPA